MINKQKVLGYMGLSTKAGKIVFGTDAVTEAIYKKKIKLVLIAEDCADRTKNNFENLCKNNLIPYYIFGTIEENSKAIGKSNKAVIGIKDINFANQIIKIINGGEFIGKNKNA